MTIETLHPETGYTNNVKIIEEALRGRFGFDDGSHVLTAVAAHIWSHLVSQGGHATQKGYTWSEVEVANALSLIRGRLAKMDEALQRVH